MSRRPAWAARAGRAAGAAVVGAGGLLLATASPAAAHGIGGRSDLPLPVWMFAYGAAGALIVSFAALAAFWPAARLKGGVGGLVLVPARRRGLVAGLARAGRTIGVGLYLIVLAAALFGPGEAQDNLAPAVVYIVFWVGLTFVCALVGNVWRVLSPFPALAAGFEKARRRRAGDDQPASDQLSTADQPADDQPAADQPAADGPADDDQPAADQPAADQSAADGALSTDGRPYLLGHWPAAVLLFGFVWLELAYPDRADPRQLGAIILVYSAIVLVGAFLWGRPFLHDGEAFAGFFGILSAAGVVHVDDEGQVRLRPPLSGLPMLRVLPGTVAVILVALGSTSFDGLSRTRLWLDLVGNLGKWPSTIALTFGLLAMIAVVGLAYVGAMAVVARRRDRALQDMTGAFAHTLVPIVVAYAVAHYFSFLVFEGQGALALASDPLGRGWDLFGTTDWAIDYGAISPRTVSWVQVLAIIGGHVAGVVLAHDRALALFPEGDATRSQYPLLVTMVLFTVGGLTLLLST